jgi:hypothetical protein
MLSFLRFIVLLRLAFLLLVVVTNLKWLYGIIKTGCSVMGS